MTDQPTARLVHAPWNTEQVTALNAFQHTGRMHPFTCGAEHASGQSPMLVATNGGWVCPDPQCTYRQDWAHAFMAQPAVPVSSPPPDQTAHACDNCSGIDPDSCPFKPDRPSGAAAAVSPPPNRAATLTDTERNVLRSALDMAEEEMLALGDDEDQLEALNALRRLAAEAQQPDTGTPAASPSNRRALVHNAITGALSAAGDRVPFSVRVAATRAALAEVDGWQSGDTETRP